MLHRPTSAGEVASPTSDDALPIESRAVRKARDLSRLWHASQAKVQRQQPPPAISLPEGHPEVDEQDFTTPGATPGRLGCPFAAMAAQRKRAAADAGGPQKPLTPTTGMGEDPIAAEFHRSASHSPPPSAAGSGAKCPIRFLDQHKPEEVAQYFENHKHEIPRSHEVCIKQYQTNEESVRKLDAKYGSLVNMIQGLGMKHKPMLPEEANTNAELDDGQAMSEKGVAKIQQWAGTISAPPPAEEGPIHETDEANAPPDTVEESRTPRFERDLRDVRLGESPSRPWGIQVPAEFEDQVENNGSSSGHRGGHDPQVDQIPTSQPVPLASKGEEARPISQKSPLVFNGPVFFGYSAEDMARLLQEVPQLRTAAATPQ